MEYGQVEIVLSWSDNNHTVTKGNTTCNALTCAATNTLNIYNYI